MGFFFQGIQYIFMVYGVFQVGHRDLEDILKDIDLNGDGRVDFEGKNRDFLKIYLPQIFISIDQVDGLPLSFSFYLIIYIFVLLFTTFSSFILPE